MLLHVRAHGAGPVVVILHGLMGSGANWHSIAKALACQYRVLCLDLPNHGKSPHVARHTLRDVCNAVAATLDACNVQRCVLLGHSYGGKVAMQFAADFSERLRGLVVVDISPRAFKPFHLFILRACQQLDLHAAARRQELDTALAHYLPDAALRAFLLKNIVRDAQNKFQWSVPLQYLIENHQLVSAAPTLDRRYHGAALFIDGGDSAFKVAQDAPLIRQYFPQAECHTIAGAGHMVHIDQPQALIHQLQVFMRGLEA